MKKLSVLLFLGFCMLISGCSGSNSSSTPSTSPDPAQTKSVTVTLPSQYKINGVSTALPSGKSWRIIACGNTSDGKELFQEHVFTQTGSAKTFNLPVYSNVASFIVVNTIALDGSFVDDAGASYVKGRCLMVTGHQTTVGSITFSETDNFMIVGTASSMMKVSDLVSLYKKQYNLKFSLAIK